MPEFYAQFFHKSIGFISDSSVSGASPIQFITVMFKASTRRILSGSLVLAFLLLLLWAFQLQINAEKDTIWNYQFNNGVAFFYLLAAVIAYLRLKRTGPKNTAARSALWCFMLAGLFWCLAFVTWMFYNVVLKVDTPYPSLADVFFLLSYPLLGFGIWSLHNLYKFKPKPEVIRDSIIIVLVAAVLIFAVLNRPDLSPDLGMSKNLLNVVYSLADVVLVAAALIELRSGLARKHRGLYIFVLFLLFQASADFMFAYRNNSGIYWNGDAADLLFGISGFMLALALMQDSLLKPPVKQSNKGA